MVQADYRGARGSNAGDDFHEFWALRQALALLAPDTGLTAVAVEGLTAEDESGTPQDTWDGVDCTLYYGSDHAASAERIVIDQLKYSAADPDKAWTVARLTHSSNKKKDNSVIGRLGKAFAGVKAKWPSLIESGKVVVRLISNQPVASTVINALSSHGTPSRSSHEWSKYQADRDALRTASGLQENNFEPFAGALDLSECGRRSRFALEESVHATISEWKEDDSRAAVNDLLRFVHRAMLPEGKREFITSQSILAWMGFSDPGALFPCPHTLKRVERLIPRGASRDLVERMLGGMQRICLHGEGGCGKTTALQEIEALLPSDSLVIIFDCFGNGRYLDADAYRHRSRDAFLQLSNDLANRLRIPLLVNRSADLDYPKVFKKRLEKAAEVVAARAGDALLVIVVDAADNSVTAASTRSPAEPSFVHDFMALGELPKNVRFIVTGRTGLLQKLHLPHSFTHLPITGFTYNETVAHVRGMWKDAPDSWIEDFHHLSHGNPRVQRYALDYAGAEPARALDYLRPQGKGLDQIFLEQLKHARLKAGHDQDISVFCAGLIALPRPVPIADLSAVTGLNEHHIRDLCSDLAPGVRVTNSSIGFADEDFEHFVRTEAEMQLGLMQTRIADHFVSRHRSDEYAAAHVAAALLVAGRGREIINLIHTEREPKAIGDPVLRREAQLQRLRIAMKVCRDAGDNVEAMLILLIGAEALKTDAAIRGMLVENPDLAAHFARDTSSRAILRDPDEIQNHGPLLFQLMSADARDKDGISVREGHRQIRAWLQRRDEHFTEQRKQHPHFQPDGWSIDARDIAAETEAVLRIVGPRPAVESVLRWSPRSIALRVASILSFKLITSGETDFVERCLTEAEIATPWNLFLLTPLALSGRDVDLPSLETSLASLLRRRLIRPEKLNDAFGNDNATAEYLDMILTACEAVIARGGDRPLSFQYSRDLRTRTCADTINSIPPRLRSSTMACVHTRF
ncbi:MAG: ATP-binding protein [Nitrospirota bacterium]|nr:ATP-binding protein [Nitrospirota bacterium]